jgi:hypothetical protein
MRVAVTAILVASAGVAAAQPAPETPCAVNIAHAPDDVRSVVETWVRGEARCHGGELEVRIVPTDGGFYLFARDTSGRVRERVVPDAQSAGVLVASWAADDGVEAPPPPPPPVVSAPRPGLVQPVESLGVVAPAPRHVMLGLGAMVGNVYGLRAELDMTRYKSFVFGLSAGVSTAQVMTSDGPLTMRDLSALGYVALVLESGRFWLRPQIGLGGITSEFNKFLAGASMNEATGGDNAAVLEVSARIGADLASWTVSAGPLVRMYTETWDTGPTSLGTLLNRDGDVSFYIGVGRRL